MPVWRVTFGFFGSRDRSACQISPASNRLKVKRLPAASSRPTTLESWPVTSERAGISLISSRVSLSKNLTPPGV
jgi:hypothetical protein